MSSRRRPGRLQLAGVGIRALGAGVAIAALLVPPAIPGEEDEGTSLRIVGREIAAAHPPLDAPSTRTADDDDHMRPDDVVVGLALPGGARAYPWWVLKNRHTVNDTLMGEPILIAFCE